MLGITGKKEKIEKKNAQKINISETIISRDLVNSCKISVLL